MPFWADDSYGQERRKEFSMRYLTHAYLPLLDAARSLFRVAVADQSGDSPYRIRNELWNRAGFAAELRSVDDAPEPLRAAMLEELNPHDVIEMLIFGPAQRTIGKASPASLLAILQHEWVIAVFGENVALQVYRCEFGDTLLVELTEVFLYGRLRLDFVKNRRVQSVAVMFNTVMADLYWKAVQILLSGASGDSHTDLTEKGGAGAALKSLPLKFHNGVLRYLPAGREVRGFVHWPPTWGRQLWIFRRELAVEGVLVLTNRELLFISEEKDWSRDKYRNLKYGYVVTYCPLARVEALRLTTSNSLGALDIDICTRQLGGRLKIEFPRERRITVSAFVELVTSSPTFRGSMQY
jgi:hypothetical protein